MEREKNFQPLISRIFILPFTISHKDNDRLQTWFSPDHSMCEARRKNQPLAERIVMLLSWPPLTRQVREFVQYPALSVSDVCSALCLFFLFLLGQPAELLLVPILRPEMLCASCQIFRPVPRTFCFTPICLFHCGWDLFEMVSRLRMCCQSSVYIIFLVLCRKLPCFAAEYCRAFVLLHNFYSEHRQGCVATF